MSDDDMYFAKQRQAFHRRAGKPSRSYPVAAPVIRIHGEPTPEESASNESRLEFYKKQLRYIADELCALMPGPQAKAYLEFLISDVIRENYE